MRETIITCDRCGKKIGNDINGFPHYLNSVNIRLTYWHGGSMGGDEDVDKHSFEICGDCARELSYIIEKWRKNQIKNIEYEKEVY